MGVPGDHLPFGGLGAGQAGAGVEGPPVADRVLQVGEEPVGEGRALNDLQCSRPSTARLKPGDRYLNVGAADGDGTAFRVEWLRAAQRTLIGFSATRADPAEVTASYLHVTALVAAGSLTLPTATYSLDEAAQAWEAQACSPGRKIVVIP
jgi:hypothetical protein